MYEQHTSVEKELSFSFSTLVSCSYIRNSLIIIRSVCRKIAVLCSGRRRPTLTTLL